MTLPALAAAPDARAVANALPGNAVILFGARWCAPCSGEVRALEPLVAAVAALPVRTGSPAPVLMLAWIDRPPPVAPARLAAIAPGRVVVLPPDVAAALAEKLLKTAHGLPFAVIADAQGQVCALHQGPLQPAAMAPLWAACPDG